MITYTIFIVDDEEVIRDGIALVLRKKYIVKTFESAEKAVAAMKNNRPDLVLLDIGLPGMSGIEGLKEIKCLHPQTLIIMITAYENVETVVSAMKLGAYDYVVKPLQMEALLVNIQNALESIRMRKEIQLLQEKYLKENIPCFIGESNSIQGVIEVVKKVAGSPDTSILISGETGAGKELIANSIHYRSPNYKGPFVTVNCAAIPKELIESELFGYEKGAFSGAAKSGKTGLVEKAEGGTLFLDEIGDLGMEAQAKLLRFIEEGEFYKVGGTKKRHVRTRIVSATNKDLKHMIEEGDFRQDLYYRLAVVMVDVPSLVHRRDDIIPIARYFLLEFCKKLDKPISSISPEVENALKGHHWKGNVRELKNVIERAILIANGPELTLQDIGIEKFAEDKNQGETSQITDSISGISFPSISEKGINLPSVLESFEKYCLSEALKVSKGNESQAAKFLHISRHTFRYRRNKLELN